MTTKRATKAGDRTAAGRVVKGWEARWRDKDAPRIRFCRTREEAYDVINTRGHGATSRRVVRIVHGDYRARALAAEAEVERLKGEVERLRKPLMQRLAEGSKLADALTPAQLKAAQDYIDPRPIPRAPKPTPAPPDGVRCWVVVSASGSVDVACQHKDVAEERQRSLSASWPQFGPWTVVEMAPAAALVEAQRERDEAHDIIADVARWADGADNDPFPHKLRDRVRALLARKGG